MTSSCHAAGWCCQGVRTAWLPPGVAEPLHGRLGAPPHQPSGDSRERAFGANREGSSLFPALVKLGSLRPAVIAPVVAIPAKLGWRFVAQPAFLVAHPVLLHPGAGFIAQFGCLGHVGSGPGDDRSVNASDRLTVPQRGQTNFQTTVLARVRLLLSTPTPLLVGGDALFIVLDGRGPVLNVSLAPATLGVGQVSPSLLKQALSVLQHVAHPVLLASASRALASANLTSSSFSFMSRSKQDGH
jgi:hypothetical protein